MSDLANWRKLTRHPLSAIFPDMSEVEFESLLADMKQHGYDQKQQVWLFEGKVLDGWHRLRAAVMNDKMPTFDTYKGDDAMGFVIRRNLTRRHLNESQRGLIAGRMTNTSYGGNRKSSGESEENQVANWRLEDAADLLNIGKRTAQRGKKVADEGAEELQTAVMDGTVSVSDAAAVADKPKPKQRRAVKAVKSGKAKTLKEAVNGKHGDAYEGDEKPKGAIKCSACDGKGWVTRETRDALWDAIVDITGADSKVNGARIGKLCKLLMSADPPYSADDILKLPAAVKKRWPSLNFAFTLKSVENYIGWVRKDAPEGTHLFDGLKQFLAESQG